MARQKVAIIGAGMGGLATANLLARAGYAVDVFERHDTPGGRAGELTADGFRFDTGPSWYLMPEVFTHFYKLIGENIASHITLHRLDPAYKVWFEDRTSLQIHTELDRDAALFDRYEVGAGVALKQYIEEAGTTYDLAKKYFLYNTFVSKRAFWQPEVRRHRIALLRAGGQSLHRRAAATFSSPKLQQVMEYGAVFLGGSPFKVPALYGLMSYLDFAQGVFYPDGGIYRVIESLEGLAKQGGARFHYRTAASAITVAGGRASGVKLANGELVQADIVVSDADLRFTELSLLPPSARSYGGAYWVRRTPGPSALLMYLGIKGKLPMLDHHNLLFTEHWRRNFSDIFEAKTMPAPASMYVCRPGATDTTVAPPGHENLFVLVPIPAGRLLGADELQAYAGRYVQQLAEWCGVPDLPQRIVYRKLYGPQDFVDDFSAFQGTALGLSHTLRQSAFFRTANRSRKLPNLLYVGAGTRPGIGLPMCLISAQLVYKLLAGDTMPGPLESLRLDLGRQPQ